jgi:hypothetical protein
MVKCRLDDQSSFRLKYFLYLLVCSLECECQSGRVYNYLAMGSYLHMLTNKIRNLLREFSSVVDGAWRHFVMLQDTIRNGNTMVIFTECRSLVDDTRSICIGHIGINENSESPIFELIVETN